jgi:hypothetical protein
MSVKEQNRRQELIDRFVSSFEKLDEMTAFPHETIALQFATSEPDEYGGLHWRPKKLQTNSAALQAVYAYLPARFPPLFEQLLLSYRWAEIDLVDYRLLPNPLGPGLLGFLEQMSHDRAIWNALIPAGYVQFGKGADMDYDPVCLDISSPRKNRDYRIVKIDHERILCFGRIKVVAEVASSFEDLVLRTIDRGSKFRSFGVPIS